jgi:pilus assembly protein Flp/PilA
MIKLLQKLRRDEEGATAIEYGLIAALISVAAIIAMQTIGESLSTLFTGVSTSMDDAVGTGTATS